MSTLVLELKPEEILMINGAVIRFRTKAQIELKAKARFVAGRQVMSPDAANSPADHVYLALQSAYTGLEKERQVALATACKLIADFKTAKPSPLVCETLDAALAAARAGDGYRSLRLTKLVMRLEDAGRRSSA